jgi:uncharacterized membrane protein YphA (DoxX/SURF4 family)
MGLILLRFALAFCEFDQGFRAVTGISGTSWAACFFGLLAIVMGVALLIGFLTPVAGAFASLGYLANGLSFFISADPNGHSNALSILNLFVMSLALVLLGPGAFSVDARLFGHREIVIPDGGRPRL